MSDFVCGFEEKPRPQADLRFKAMIASHQNSVILNNMSWNYFFRLWIVIAALVVLLIPNKSNAQPSSVHADLPLWTSFESLWPRSFNDDDSFGCSGPIKFGDWKLTYFPKTDEADAYTPDSEWLKIHNYGVFHCAYGFRWSYEFKDLETASAKLGHLVELGLVDTPNGERKLWAIQSGFSPGSDYIFLTRASSSKPDASYEVLDVQCPKKHKRTAGRIDIFGTEYCAINNQRSMRRLARKMAQKAPIGRLEYIEESAE